MDANGVDGAGGWMPLGFGVVFCWERDDMWFADLATGILLGAHRRVRTCLVGKLGVGRLGTCLVGELGVGRLCGQEVDCDRCG